MDKIMYIIIKWEVPDYGGTKATPYFVHTKKRLISLLKEFENCWEDIDVFEVKHQIFSKSKNG